jgi:hypothetical protein
MKTISAAVNCGLLLLVVLNGGCGRKDEPPVAPAPAPQAPVATSPAPASQPPAAGPAPAPSPPAIRPTVLASQEFNSDPTLKCDVLEVKRVSGNALLVRWRLSKVAATGRPYHAFEWDDTYFIDPVENKKYFGLRDSAGTWIAQGRNMTYDSGDQQAMWIKFPAPPATSNKIMFVFPGFPPFEDLPVS